MKNERPTPGVSRSLNISSILSPKIIESPQLADVFFEINLSARKIHRETLLSVAAYWIDWIEGKWRTNCYNNGAVERSSCCCRSAHAFYAPTPPAATKNSEIERHIIHTCMLYGYTWHVLRWRFNRVSSENGF